VSRAQPGDREVAAWGTAVVAGERVAACACGGEDSPAALLNRCVCLLVPATAAEEEGQGRCSRERAQVFSACCRCGRASSVRAAATRRGHAGLSPPGCGRDAAHVGAAAAGDPPLLYDLLGAEADHRDGAVAAVGDVQVFAVAAGIEAVRPGAGPHEADHLQAVAVDFPYAACAEVGDVEDLPVG